MIPQQQQAIKAKPYFRPENVFQLVLFLVVVMWSIFCKDILKFREYLKSKELFFYSMNSMWYALVSFVFVIVTKYGYYALARKYVDEKILLEKYEGESRKFKLESVLKLTYDSVFYLSTSIISFVLFRHEPWFPNWVGGEGKCENLYLSYPSIPTEREQTISIFYSLQLGVHLFSVFEMMVIKRKIEAKYYQKLLHHILAASLIAFSALSNEILVGILILFTHDFSDVFMAFGRVYIETKFKKVWYIGIPVIFSMVFWWIFMRIIVFPLCLISNVSANTPTPVDQFYISYNLHKLLEIKLIVLLGMHAYWTYHIIKSIYISVGKQNYSNQHESGKQKVTN